MLCLKEAAARRECLLGRQNHYTALWCGFVSHQKTPTWPNDCGELKIQAVQPQQARVWPSVCLCFFALSFLLPTVLLKHQLLGEMHMYQSLSARLLLYSKENSTVIYPYLLTAVVVKGDKDELENLKLVLFQVCLINGHSLTIQQVIFHFMAQAPSILRVLKKIIMKRGHR